MGMVWTMQLIVDTIRKLHIHGQYTYMYNSTSTCTLTKHPTTVDGVNFQGMSVQVHDS